MPAGDFAARHCGSLASVDHLSRAVIVADHRERRHQHRDASKKGHAHLKNGFSRSQK